MKKINLLSGLVMLMFPFKGVVANETVDCTIFRFNIITLQDSYQEIAISALPETVRKSVEKEYSGSTIEKAYINERYSYRLILVLDGKSQTVYINADGEWIAPANE